MDNTKAYQRPHQPSQRHVLPAPLSDLKSFVSNSSNSAKPPSLSFRGHWLPNAEMADPLTQYNSFLLQYLTPVRLNGYNLFFGQPTVIVASSRSLTTLKSLDARPGSMSPHADPSSPPTLRARQRRHCAIAYFRISKA